jgi:hypothetical protein
MASIPGNIYRKDVVSGKKITIPLIVIEEV